MTKKVKVRVTVEGTGGEIYSEDVEAGDSIFEDGLDDLIEALLRIDNKAKVTIQRINQEAK